LVDEDAQLQELILKAKGCPKRSRKGGMKVDFSRMRSVDANLVAFKVVGDLQHLLGIILESYAGFGRAKLR
jgi:hypothetical protein